MLNTPFNDIKKKISNEISPKIADKIPKKWEKIGNVLILKIEEEIIEYKKEISKIYSKILNCKSVLIDIGGINGIFRTPNLELVYGSKNTETIHIENGIKFKLDPVKIMFSSGNISERIRMSNISNKNETLVDLFAGIGYFSIPIAFYSKPKKIYSCEINPISYNYLLNNIVLNHVTSIIKPLLGDNKKTAPYDIANRVLLGYFKETKKYFSLALKCLKNKSGFIHYHDILPKKQIPDNPINILKEIAKNQNAEINTFDYKKIKTYAPGINHYVFDIEIGGK